MSEAPEQWMPRERWDALVLGDGCPLCAAFVNAGFEDEHGFTIADLQISRLRLARNQDVQGYCVLICHRHIREPYELSVHEQAMFFEDMCRAGLALERAFDAVKMNFHILGNAVPHLHAHIQPRYYGDRAPNRIIWGDDQHPLSLSPDDYAARIALIQRHLTSDI
jgi:diadenosine tetraphosphate (Ap4A) HIT family hydrolase